jgi:hypothetical protein
MKRLAIFLFGALITVTMGYGQPVVNSFGGVLFPAGKTTIELQDLSIVLEQRGEWMWSDGVYDFYNPDFHRTLTVGFLTLPYIPADRKLDTRLNPNIEQLEAQMNGAPVVLGVKPIAETEFQREIKEITELSYIYYASIRFRKGHNTLRLSYGFLPSRDSTGVDGQIYYPFTISPAGLWASRSIGTLTLRIKMEEGSRFTLPRNLGSPAARNPWRLTGEGKMSRSDLTRSSDDELLYVYLKSGAVELVRDNYTVGRDLMIQIYNPLDHVEPLKSMYWRVYNGKGLEQYTPEDLRIARNTLFALHGYRFESRDLLQHFSRYFWYEPDPDVPNSKETLTGSEQALLRSIMGQEKIPGRQTHSLDLFLDRFRRSVLRHDWSEVIEYLDPDYVQDQLDGRFDGNRYDFLSEIFGGVDHNRITALEYGDYPDGVADDKVVDRFSLKVSVPGSQRSLAYQIRRAGSSFRLVGPHDGVTNYEHGSFRVRDVRSIVVKMRSVGDQYARCYSIWIEDGTGGYLNLDGGSCDPDAWKASHCSCPTVAGVLQRSYDLSRYTRTPYTGEVVVAVSSYVGYWRVEVETESTALVPPAKAGRSWSTPTDSSQRHAEVRNIRYRVSDGMLKGEATFLTWNRAGCPGCIQQIVLISDHKTGGLYDAVCIDMGIPGLFPGTERRLSFEMSYPEEDTKIWAFPALQYTCDDAVSLARQNFPAYREENLPIIGD